MSYWYCNLLKTWAGYVGYIYSNQLFLSKPYMNFNLTEQAGLFLNDWYFKKIFMIINIMIQKYLLLLKGDKVIKDMPPK